MANPYLVTDVTSYCLEDDGADLAISASTSTSDGSEYLVIEITGIPSGWTASGPGTFNATAGIWSLTLAPGESLTAGPALTPPANSDADVALLLIAARAHLTANGALSGTRIRAIEIITDAAADAPLLTAADVSGNEDTAIGLDLSAALADTDGSESIAAVRISGVPEGFAIDGGTDEGSGIWQVPVGSLAEISISAPTNYYGTLTLTLSAVSAETLTSGDEPETANNSATSLASFDVTFHDVNDPAALALANTLTTLSEGASTADAIKVADLAITDDTLGDNVLSLTGEDAALFEISGGALYLKAGTALDYETNAVLDVTVVMDDETVGASPDAAIAYALYLTDVNEAPRIVSGGGGPSAAMTAPEEQNFIGFIAAIDPENRPVSYSVVAVADGGAADAARFTIDAATGVLSFVTPRDFENPVDAGANNVYEVTVRATDAIGGLADEQVISVTVTDVNEAPRLGATRLMSTLSEAASTTAAILVADLSVSDDALGSNMLTLSGADADHFELKGGDLYLKAGTSLDFETETQLSVTVSLDDASLSAGPEAVEAFTVTVTDANEAPRITLSNVVYSVAEYASEATAIRVADIAITDDALGSESITLAGIDAALFEVIGSALYLKRGTFIEQMQNATLDVTITVDDPTIPGAPDGAQALAISVAAVDAVNAYAGTPSSDVASGTPFADKLDGRDGADALWGFAGADQLLGGGGDDLLTGGFDKDYLTGGAGRDRFDFNTAKETRSGYGQRDVITDFTRGEDKIDLKSIDAKKGMGGNQKFKFIGRQEFHDKKGELHYLKKSGFVIVEGDINGDGRADFQIEVHGASKLGAGDFIL